MTSFVHYMQMPHRIKGYVSKNEDGTYTIILNSRLTYEQNLITYIHEMSHIQNNDFDKGTINEAEWRVNSGV